MARVLIVLEEKRTIMDLVLQNGGFEMVSFLEPSEVADETVGDGDVVVELEMKSMKVVTDG